MGTCIERHTVAIHDRGGVRRIDELATVSRVEYAREEGGRTTAVVEISADNCLGQMERINALAAHRHELVIFRGDERVWEGPLIESRWYSNRLVLVAQDVTAYLDTPLSRDWPNEESGGPRYMTERIAQIIAHELSEPYEADVGLAGVPNVVEVPRWENLTPPANVLPYLDIRSSVGPSGILTFSDTVAFEMTTFEHLNNLARGGLQYTAIGRRILIWDRAQPIGSSLRPLTDADFYGEIAVIAAGGEHAVIAHVSAQREEESDGESVDGVGVGSAGGPDSFYGVWTRLVTLESEDSGSTPDQMALNTQARRQLIGRGPSVPTEVIVPNGSGLRLGPDLRINDLIPGVIVPVRASFNLRNVSQDQRLESVKVIETPDGETVQVTLSPAGELEALS